MTKVAVVTGSLSGIGYETSLLVAINQFTTYATMRHLNKDTDCTNTGTANTLITGTNGQDTLLSNNDNNLMNGLGGNDRMNGCGGNDSFNGNTGSGVRERPQRRYCMYSTYTF